MQISILFICTLYQLTGVHCQTISLQCVLFFLDATFMTNFRVTIEAARKLCQSLFA